MRLPWPPLSVGVGAAAEARFQTASRLGEANNTYER